MTNTSKIFPAPLRAITLHRPWPYAILHLGKRIENRTWHCWVPPGSWMAIHAGKKFDKAGANFIQETAAAFGKSMPEDPAAHPTGVVALARFTGNIRQGDPGYESPWFTGPVGWQFDRVVAVPPITIGGWHSIWNIPNEHLPALREAYQMAESP